MTSSRGRSTSRSGTSRTEGRRSTRTNSQWLLAVLLVLAIAASIAMIFTSNIGVAGALAVVAALWAAVIGAILVTKFRRVADTADAKARDLRLVYELQLEREIAARREYELGVESRVRSEVSQESRAELEALQEEVRSLRTSLQSLMGELPDDDRALGRRDVRELGAGQEPFGSGRFGSSAGLGADRRYEHTIPDDMVAERDFASTTPPAAGQHASSGAAFSESLDETEIIPAVVDEADDAEVVEDIPEPAAGRGEGIPREFLEQDRFEEDRRPRSGRHGSGFGRSPYVSAPEPDPAGKHGQGQSVSELIEQLKKSTGGGRRRARD